MMDKIWHSSEVLKSRHCGLSFIPKSEPSLHCFKCFSAFLPSQNQAVFVLSSVPDASCTDLAMLSG